MLIPHSPGGHDQSPLQKERGRIATDRTRVHVAARTFRPEPQKLPVDRNDGCSVRPVDSGALMLEHGIADVGPDQYGDLAPVLDLPHFDAGTETAGVDRRVPACVVGDGSAASHQVVGHTPVGVGEQRPDGALSNLKIDACHQQHGPR